jgi:hypothetical protein
VADAYPHFTDTPFDLAWADNALHYAVGIKDGDVTRIYVDGVQVGSREYGPPICLDSSANAAIGKTYAYYFNDGPKFFWNGMIYDVKIWNYTRSDAEIWRDWEAGP